MKVFELIAALQAMPPDLDVIISSQGETTQVPLECAVEATCNEDDGGEGEQIVWLYTDNGEQE